MTEPKLSYGISPLTVKEGFTQSELTLLDECALKWNYRYNNLLTRADSFDWPMWVGSQWHSFQENWRKTKGDYDLATVPLPEFGKNILRDSEFEKQLEYWMQVLPAYQLAYAKLYPEEAEIDFEILEQELEATYMGVRLRGKIDLALSKPKFIRDFKSTSSAWLISPAGWHFKFQFMFYCWLIVQNNPKTWAGQFDFQLDMMQRPGLRQTKADVTWQGHIRRVCGDVRDRAEEYYLSRKSFKVTPEAIRAFEERVLTPKIQRIHLAIDNPNEAISIVTNPNTNACNSYGKQCEFFEICEKGWSAGKFFFTNRPVKHQELE